MGFLLWGVFFVDFPLVLVLYMFGLCLKFFFTSFHTNNLFTENVTLYTGLQDALKLMQFLSLFSKFRSDSGSLRVIRKTYVT